MRKLKPRSLFAIKNDMIDYQLRWDMSKYPYATIKTTTEDVDNSFESPQPIDSKHLEKLLGWTAKIATPALTAAQICDRIDPISDEYVISPSKLEKVLLHHPAYVTLEPKEKFSTKGFIPRKTLIESACRYLLTWCSHAEPEESVTDILGERICRLIASPYQLKPDELWTLLEQVGVIEKLGDEDISAADMRTFLAFCQYWGLQAEVVLSWDGFQARAQYRILKPVHLDLGYGGYWLSQFDDDERTLIEKRLLDGHTLEELGEALGVSREGARQRTKKVIDRLQHPAFRIIFGYVLGQNLFELSSMRLVFPDRIANKMENYFGRRITNRGLYQILKTIAMVEPIQVYNSDWLWINWGKDFGKLPGLERWEKEYDINEEDYLSVARRCTGGLSKTEDRILFRCAEESHRSIKRLRPCIIRTLNILKRPAHFKDIAAKSQELFPDFPKGFSASRVNSVLQNLERADEIKKVDRAIYALSEYAEEEILPSLSDPQPTEITTFPLCVTSDLDYDTILEEIENEKDHYKNLFIGLDPINSDAVCKAILRIIKAVEDLPTPRSLCELRINQEGYQWLILWAKHIDASTLRALLDDYEQYLEWGAGKATPVALGAGLLLLLLATEVGRRESISSMLWPFLRKRLNDDARKIVFQGNQGINQRFKDVIESTCRKFNLRHVLGQEGTQSYYITMTLQYGFALSHLKQLPLTLTGHKNLRAFDLLLSTHLKSESFFHLFHTLRDFRFNRISLDIATKILDANPWVLPEKTQDVLDATKSVEELEDQLSTPNIQVSGEDDGQHVMLVHSPNLRWDGVDKPFFECPLQQLDRMDLNDDRYDLFVGERYMGSLLRDANGSYGCIEEIRIHLDSPQQIIRLCDSEGKTCYTQELQLWNEDDDLMVSVFLFPSGRKINAWERQMDTQSQYVLITLTDLGVEPSIEPWRLVGEGKWRLILLQKGWSPDLKITMEEDDFWSPLLKSEQSDKSISHLSDWEQKIQIKVVSNATLEFGDKFDLAIKNIPPEVKISHAIFCKKPVAVTPLPEERRIKNIELTPEVALAIWRGSKIEFRLDCNGDKKRLRLPVDLDFMGSVIERKTRWKPMFIGREVTVRELESNRVQVFVPNHWRGERFQDLALMEGSVFLRRLWKRPRTLGGLVGLGAPLKVQKPYNCLSEEKLLTLSTEVVDRGIIDQVLMDETLIDIFLHRDVEPGSDHFLIGVSPNGRVSQFEIEMHEGRQWLAEIDSPLVACGIAYRGECVGSWWEDHIEILDSLDAKSIQNVAAMMRWLHLPILKPTWREKVIRFIETNLVAVLSAWVQDQGLPRYLCFNETYETWFANIGELFVEIPVEPEHASAIVDLMIQDQFLNNFGKALHCLGHINPIFMGRVVQALLDSRYRNFKESEWNDHLQSAKRRFLYLPSRASEQDTRIEEENRLDEAAQSMILAPSFLKHVAQQGVEMAKSGRNRHLSAINRENLEISMNVQPFNRYLCINIFNDIIRNL